MTRYTNFGSFVQRTEYLNEMRRQEEIDDGTTNNSLVSARLSPVPPQATPQISALAQSQIATPDSVHSEAGLLRAGEGAEVLA